MKVTLQKELPQVIVGFENKEELEIFVSNMKSLLENKNSTHFHYSLPKTKEIVFDAIWKKASGRERCIYNIKPMRRHKK